MSTPAMRRLAGGLVAGGGVLFAVGNLLHPLEHNHAAHAAPVWEAAHLIFALGGLLIAAGLPLLVAVGEVVRPSRLTAGAGVALALAFAALAPGAWFEAFVAPLPGGVAEGLEDGPGGAVNAVAGLVWIVSMLAFGVGLVRGGMRAPGVALLVAGAALIAGPGIPVKEGLVIIPATVVAGAGLAALALTALRPAASRPVNA